MVARTLLKRIETELKVDENKAASIFAAALSQGFIEPGPEIGIMRMWKQGQPTIKLGRPGLLKL